MSTYQAYIHPNLGVARFVDEDSAPWPGVQAGIIFLAYHKQAQMLSEDGCHFVEQKAVGYRCRI